MQNHPLTLQDNDPKVIAAREAEQQLFALYGIKAIDHYVVLPHQGIRVRVSVIGQGKPLVIVPGNTGEVFPLASLLAQFKNRRIIAINRPGGGLSEGIDHTTVDIRQFAIQTLETVFSAFGLESADVVAHSMGAHWGLWLAMHRPKLVRSITLLGNPGNVMHGGPPAIMRLLTKPPLNKLLFRLLVPADKTKALRPLKAVGHSQATLNSQPQALADTYYYFRLLPHYRISALSLLQNAAPNIDEQQLSQVNQPVLFILGDKDTFASVKTGQSIAAAITNCTLKIIPGAGHLPWMENAETCGELINNFLKG